MNHSNISILFMSYDIYLPGFMNSLKRLIVKVLSPRFASVAVKIDNKVYHWTPKGIQTQISTNVDYTNITELQVYPTDQQFDDFTRTISFAQNQKGDLYVALATVFSKYETCATIASRLIGWRIVTPDKLYEVVKSGEY